MTNSPKVVFNYKFELAINNPDRHRRSENKIIKRTVGMFDYYSNVKKQAMNIFDYYTGDINKNEKMNLILENGKLATKEDIEKRKKQYAKYINNSNLSKCVVSFNNDYINENIDIHKLEQLMVKEVIPMFLKKLDEISSREKLLVDLVKQLYSDLEIVNLTNPNRNDALKEFFKKRIIGEDD